MNVVHVVVAGEVGGAERMLVDLAGRAARDRHSVALLTPNGKLRSLLLDAGLTVDDRGKVRENALSYLTRSLGPLDARWLRGVLEKRSADVVHLHTFASQVLGTRAALGARRPVVRTEHSTRVYDDPSCWPFSKWSLERVNAVVCISEHVARVARAKAPWIASKVRVVPNGVDTDHFAPRPAARDDGPLRFVALGRLDRRKGIDTALTALAEVPEAELAIVGEGEERAALTALARELGVLARVRFAGYQADVRDEITKADAALSSARAEGLGIALLEAMAMGKPVVALPTGGVPEIVEDGATGWLARGSDATALSGVMRDSLDRAETKRRGALARDRVVDRFSVEAMRRGYDAVYDEVTGDRRSGR